MPSVPNNWFREHSPAQITAKVGEITLAVISEWTEEELNRVGWTNNPIIDILYSLTSAGVWIARTDASGQEKVVEASGAAISNWTSTSRYLAEAAAPPMVTPAVPASAAQAAAMRHRIAQIPLTEAAGAIAATIIVPGVAGYKSHCIVKKIYAPAGTTDAANTWTLTSEAGGALTGPAAHTMNLTAGRNHWIDAGVAGVSGEGIRIYNTTAEKDILIEAADLAIVGIDYYLEIEYWYEA